MCRAVPAHVIRVNSDVAWVVDDATEIPVSIIGLLDIQPGDYVYHHAGLALRRVDAEEAEAILAAYAELDALLSDDSF
jgi:hydrogenase assembly chaperone HypC/HupF